MSYGLPKSKDKNYGSAVKSAWGWELLSARTAGAERVKTKLKGHLVTCIGSFLCTCLFMFFL